MKQGKWLHYKGTMLDMKKHLAIEALRQIDLNGNLTRVIERSLDIKDIVVGGDSCAILFSTRKGAEPVVAEARKEFEVPSTIQFGWAWLKVEGQWWLLLSWDYREITVGKGK